MVEPPRKKWTMRFDGSVTITSNSLGIMLSCDNAHLTGLAIMLNIGVKNMRVLEDSNLVVS